MKTENTEEEILMKIGFIGLGIMGKPMAINLLKAGYTDLLVNNRSQAPVQELEDAGAKGATQQEIGEQCDVVITMLPNSPQVKAVMLSEDGVAAHMKPGAVFIDCSSINPVASKEMLRFWQQRALKCWTLPCPAESPRPLMAPSASWWAANRRSLIPTRSCC